MPAFPIKGSTGQAPTTVYFGTVPDRLNILQRAFLNNTTGWTFASDANGQSPANLVSNWQIYNPSSFGGTNVNTASFGANTSAPDGTNNGIKVVEATNNGIHEVQTVFTSNYASHGGYKLRVSVFAKAAEHTRFALYMGNNPDPNTGSSGGQFGCKTVFDVGNGQIGVANQAFQIGGTSASPAYVPGPTEITPFGSGWYRCTMDVLMGGSGGVGNNALGIFILIDKNSGTAAENTNYVGDGTSGLFFWRSTCLPPGAWALNNVTYFEDFTSLAKFDLGKTGAPGFDWYLDYNWSGFGNTTLPPAFTNPASLSIVSGTLLKIAIDGTNLNDLAIQSAAPLHDGSGNVHLGSLFRPPALLECSCSWDGGITPNANGPTFWTRDIASLAAVHLNVVTQGCEFDFFEANASGAGDYEGTVWTCAPNPFQIAQRSGAKNGAAIWYSTYNYGPNEIVQVSGVVYQSKGVGGNLNQQPPNSTYWNVLFSTLQAPIDWTQQHVDSTLWLSNSQSDIGQILFFFDGRYCGQSHLIYSPTLPPTLPFYANQTLIDQLQYPYLFGTSNNQNCFVDFIRNTQ